MHVLLEQEARTEKVVVQICQVSHTDHIEIVLQRYIWLCIQVLKNCTITKLFLDAVNLYSQPLPSIPHILISWVPSRHTSSLNSSHTRILGPCHGTPASWTALWSRIPMSFGRLPYLSSEHKKSFEQTIIPVS